jgi:hypothetical protein
VLAYGNNCGSDDCVLVKALLREFERRIAVVRELAPTVPWAGDDRVSFRKSTEARAALLAQKTSVVPILWRCPRGARSVSGWR